MHDREPPAVDGKIDPARQARHPGTGIGVERAVGMGEPGGCELVAGAAGGKAAAAIAAPRGQALLAIAQDDPRAGPPHELHGRSGIGAIGDHVAGADHALAGNAEAFGLLEQCTRRLEIAVGAAEHDRGPVELEQRAIFPAPREGRSKRPTH